MRALLAERPPPSDNYAELKNKFFLEEELFFKLLAWIRFLGSLLGVRSLLAERPPSDNYAELNCKTKSSWKENFVKLLAWIRFFGGSLL